MEPVTGNVKHRQEDVVEGIGGVNNTKNHQQSTSRDSVGDHVEDTAELGA